MNDKDSGQIAASIRSLIYDCDSPEELAAFYSKLLGGSVTSDSYGGYTVSLPGLGFDLGFQYDEYYKRPVWLGSEQDQQPMVHIDIKVQDRQKAVEYALPLGATMPPEQFCQPDWEVQWTTLLDPAGHPFCLFEE